MKLKITDRPGVIPVAAIRECFERAMTETTHPSFPQVDITPFPCVPADEFEGYKSDETDAMWVGFALGMRCYERLQNEKRNTA